jgi:adenosylcobinamide-phosphate synthase
VVLLLSVGLDLLAGEPASTRHPVAWIGRGLTALEGRLRRRTVADGAVAVAAMVLVAAGMAALATEAGRRLGAVGVALEAVALKLAFAVRRLGGAAREVECALRSGDGDAARRLVGRHLVSRDTRGLGPAEIVSATVESIAENLTDSVAAPLLAYAAAGLPGAWAYRVVNTADAMWGYRDPRHEWFGKAAARLDDLANLVPARLAAGTLIAGAALTGARAAEAWRVTRRDHRKTESPNAGWPMAAMAGALDVALAKRGHYRLGGGPLPADPATIGRALRVFAGAIAITVGVACVLAGRRGDS